MDKNSGEKARSDRNESLVSISPTKVKHNKILRSIKILPKHKPIAVYKKCDIKAATQKKSLKLKRSFEVLPTTSFVLPITDLMRQPTT